MASTKPNELDGPSSGAIPCVEAQLAVMQLAATYAAHADGAGRGSPADLFVATGVLTLGTLRLASRDAIARFFADRAHDNAAQGRVTRHVAGQLELTADGENTVRARSTAIVFAGTGDVPLATSLPSTICDFDDVYVLTPAGWRFASRTATVVFTGAGAASFAK